MSESSRDRVGFYIEAESRTERTATSDEEPFRIALLGDFSGASERRPMAQRRPVLVDRDNFEEVLGRLKPSVELPVGTVHFAEMDDFHPDFLYTRLPVFGAFRNTRSQLSDPSTFAVAAQELYRAPEPNPDKPAAGTGDDLIDQLLAESAAAPARARSDEALDQFIRRAVRPHLTDKPDPRAPEMIRQVDEAAAATMRGILHHPAFKRLESTWRTAMMLVRRLETGTDLKIYLFDATKEELRNETRALYDWIVNRSEPLAVIASTETFGLKDVQLLQVLGQIGRKANAPLLAHADPSLLGAGGEWAEFRRSAEAGWIGLALPRILLRFPYGAATLPCEQFSFEEVSGKPEPKSMLWANTGPFCAMLLAEAFESNGWDFRPGAVREIDNLPVYVYREDGESTALPCAEIELTEDTAETLADNGFMPIASIRNSDRVRVLRFQSAADPPAPLPGRWQ